jgi:hypothetical protein
VKLASATSSLRLPLPQERGSRALLDEMCRRGAMSSSWARTSVLSTPGVPTSMGHVAHSAHRPAYSNSRRFVTPRRESRRGSGCPRRRRRGRRAAARRPHEGKARTGADAFDVAGEARSAPDPLRSGDGTATVTRVGGGRFLRGALREPFGRGRGLTAATARAPCGERGYQGPPAALSYGHGWRTERRSRCVRCRRNLRGRRPRPVM